MDVADFVAPDFALADGRVRPVDDEGLLRKYEIEADLAGIAWYGWVTSAFFLGTMIGIVFAGDRLTLLQQLRQELERNQKPVQRILMQLVGPGVVMHHALRDDAMCGQILHFFIFKFD